MSYSYQFRLKIIKLVTEQDYGIREVAKLHQISHALVIYWLKAFRERGLDGIKSPYTNLQTPKVVKPKMKRKALKFQKPQTFHLKRLKNKPLVIVIFQQTLGFVQLLNALVRFFSGLNHYLKRD